MVSVPGLMVLGLLAERDWTAYDLVKQLTSGSIANLVWNLSERTLYREPARLVAEGLATATELEDRPTTYSITAAGRAALRHARHHRNELVHQNEVLATLYATGGGSSEELVRQLWELREILRTSIVNAAHAYRAVAQVPPTMPRRALMSSLLGRLHTEMVLDMERWFTEAIDVIQTCADDDRSAFALAEWARIADTIDAAVATWDTG